MRARELKRWLAESARLTSGQREQVLARLQQGLAHDAVAGLLERRPAPAACPKCRAEPIVRNGRANGLQRFQCRGCGTSFNGLTGTPLARLGHRSKWLSQAQAMESGLSVRKAAAKLGVHRTTAFGWRHRFLAVACQAKDRPRSGVVEADEAYFLRSFKGQQQRLRA